MIQKRIQKPPAFKGGGEFLVIPSSSALIWPDSLKSYLSILIVNLSVGPRKKEVIRISG